MPRPLRFKNKNQTKLNSLIDNKIIYEKNLTDMNYEQQPLYYMFLALEWTLAHKQCGGHKPNPPK